MPSKDEMVAVPKEVLELLRSLPGIHFGGFLQPGGLMSECSCQNCSCDARHGDGCGCNPRCSCQGHSAASLDWAINVMLGAAAEVPLEDLKKIVDFRDRLQAVRAKQRGK